MLLLLLFATLVSTTEAAWLRYVDATGALTGMTREDTPPIPALPGQTVVDITPADLDEIASRAPTGCTTILPEAWQVYLHVTPPYVTSQSVVWESPLTCFVATPKTQTTGFAARPVRNTPEVDVEEQDRLAALFRLQEFDAALAAYTYQRCTDAIDGAPQTSPNCDRLRGHLTQRGPSLSNVLATLDAGDAARAALP